MEVIPMKQFMIGTAMLAGMMAAGIAQAADMAPVYKRAPVAAPAHTWTGCYIGGHAGGGVILSDFVDDTDWGGGGVAGGQIGCNYQTTWLVVGVEAEGWWSSLRGKDSFSSPNGFFSEIVKNRWDFDIALRVGAAAFGNGLLYGKAGMVWGRFDFRRQDLEENSRGSTTLPGLLLGAGLEYAFSPNWTGKIEYDYLNYVTTDTRFSGTGTFTERTGAQSHIIKVGINYMLGGR
jgi:outer membrane immunogenic protein